MKTKVLFCFDCEDYTSPRSTDMLPELAGILGRNGVVGHFMMVGLLAEAIEKQNRTDVTAALKYHDIGFHTYGHSLHPTISEYTDIESYEEAQKLLESEECAFESVRRVFERERLCAAVPPGSCISYAAMYRYAQLGIPVYADSPLKEAEEPVWFCNALHIPYDYALEEYLFEPDFSIPDFLDFISRKKRVTLYNHPNMICHTEFWDAVNYDGGNLAEFGHWMCCHERTGEEICRFFRNLEMLIRAIKEDDRFEITSISRILAETEKERVIRRSDAPAVLAMLKTNTLMPFSRSELAAAASAFLRDSTLSEWCAEPVFGFLKEPCGSLAETEVTADMLCRAAESFAAGQFLPTEVTVGDAVIGPMDFLLAAWEILAGNPMVRIQPGLQTEVPADFDNLKNLNLKGSWLHSADFEDAYLSDRLRLQAWTLHI